MMPIFQMRTLSHRKHNGHAQGPMESKWQSQDLNQHRQAPCLHCYHHKVGCHVEMSLYLLMIIAPFIHFHIAQQPA